MALERPDRVFTSGVSIAQLTASLTTQLARASTAFGSGGGLTAQSQVFGTIDETGGEPGDINPLLWGGFYLVWGGKGLSW